MLREALVLGRIFDPIEKNSLALFKRQKTQAEVQESILLATMEGGDDGGHCGKLSIEIAIWILISITPLSISDYDKLRFARKDGAASGKKGNSLFGA